MPLPPDAQSGQDRLVTEAADEPQGRPDGFDILDVMEAMGAHFHEHHEAIMRWSWKLFCRKWGRLMRWAAEERERERIKEQERAFAELQAGR